MRTFIFLLITVLVLNNCGIKKDPGISYNQIIINNTNHNVLLKLYLENRAPEQSLISSNNILQISRYAPVMGSFSPFSDYLDSIQVFIDLKYCNTYCDCFIPSIIKDSALFHKCINDSFNIATPRFYKYEEINDNEVNVSYLIDNKFCNHCR
jgi:hypothetical protein